MASEVSALPNGNYAPHQPYSDQNNFAYTTNTHISQPAQQQAPPSSITPSNAQAPQQDIPKDEVGWYFVEQYYTTLSRSPEKLYLFYNKRSQFVSGQETDKVAVCVGQRAINDKIKDLDFHDCKVRVTNVDSQASDANIVIQVIGELSNRGQPHRKFSQTFVLATQTNGYFVLNDIFRYLIEEEDEAEAETQQDEVQQVSGTESNVQEQLSTETPQNLTSSADPAAIESDAKEVAQEIEEKLVNGQAEEKPAAAAAAAAAAEEEDTPALEQKSAIETTAAQPDPAEAELEPTESAQADTEAEKPKDPEPTRAQTPKEAPQQPAPAPKAAAPAVPKTWASLAASANRVATPAAPQAAAPAAKVTAPKAATPSSQASSAAPAAPAAPVAPAAPAAPAQREESKSSGSQDEWTAVGGSHNRQQSKQVNNVQPQEQIPNRGYIKNVHESIDANKLRSELEKFGELQYFDVARQKNCAFVDFKTAEAYNKAMSTPFKIDDNELYVEERRIRPGSTPYVPRGQYQGGRGGARGGSGQGAPRGNFQGNRGNGRGGRGGTTTNGPRGGRGGAQS